MKAGVADLDEGEADGLGPEVAQESVDGVDVRDIDDPVSDDNETTATVGRKELECQHPCLDHVDKASVRSSHGDAGHQRGHTWH